MNRQQKIQALQYVSNGVPRHIAFRIAKMSDVIYYGFDETREAERTQAELKKYGISDKRVMQYVIVTNEESIQEFMTDNKAHGSVSGDNNIEILPIEEVSPQATKTRLREQQEPDPKPDPEPEKKPIINDWIGDDESSAPPGWRRAVASFSIYTD